ncbi:MAG TPA: hypothetical protein VG015_04630 [Candidatus Dormibacteraeota bacterium]|jgi:chromosome segregation ATPase|nr:hypothetical protein [Candidatus Dormibacteraeota bacterium]
MTQGTEVVQKLLGEVRDLKVERERLLLELTDIRQRNAGPDPNLRKLEQEIKRLRVELEIARGDRDTLREGILEALDRFGRG